MLLRRELISVFCYIWKFICDSYKRRQPLWPCVRRELVHARALLPLARAEGYQGWAEDVFAFDASKTGFGVVRQLMSADQAKDIGRVRERARFAGPIASDRAARSAALREEEWRLSDAGALLIGRVARFPEVQCDVLQSSWMMHASRRWRKHG